MDKPGNSRVIIAKLDGFAQVESLREEEDGTPSVMLVPDFNLFQASNSYDTFVRRPTGVIERDFGHRSWSLWISQRLDKGTSWHLGAYLVHALRAHDALWTSEDSQRRADRTILATGAINAVGMAVEQVSFVSEKLTNALPELQAAQEAGQDVIVIIPAANLNDLTQPLRDAYLAAGIAVHGVANVAEALQILGIDLRRAQTPWQGSPWPGLTAYSAQQRAIFFGRSRARAEVLDRLLTTEARSINGKRRAFVLVHGASGAGKSSLVFAGLVGDLQDKLKAGPPWIVLTHEFSAEAGPPMAALLSTLVGGLNAQTGSAAKLPHEAGPDQILDRLAGARLLLVLDQFEQALDPAAPDETERLAVLLDALSASGRVWIVATMRSGHLDLLGQSPTLSELAADDRLYRLSPPQRQDYAEIIEGPAKLAGITFSPLSDGSSLSDRLAGEAAISPDSLPLLQLVLSRIWGYAADGAADSTHLDRIGGLAGAAATWADEAVAELEAKGVAPETLDRFLAELIRIDPETGQVLARSPLMPTTDGTGGETGGQDQDATRVAEQLVAARLLTTDGLRVRLAHEALLRRWPRLQRLVDTLHHDIILREDLEHEAALWDRERRNPEHVRQGANRIAAALALRDTGLVPLGPLVGDYLAATEMAAKARRRSRILRRRVLPLALVTAAAIVGAVVFDLRDRAESADLRAQTYSDLRALNLAVAEAEDGRIDDALLHLMSASGSFASLPQAELPDELLIAFDRVLRLSDGQERHVVPSDATVFTLNDRPFLHTPSEGQLYRIAQAGPPERFAAIAGRILAAKDLRDGSAVIAAETGSDIHLYRVSEQGLVRIFAFPRPQGLTDPWVELGHDGLGLVHYGNDDGPLDAIIPTTTVFSIDTATAVNIGQASGASIGVDPEGYDILFVPEDDEGGSLSALESQLAGIGVPFTSDPWSRVVRCLGTRAADYPPEAGTGDSEHARTYGALLTNILTEQHPDFSPLSWQLDCSVSGRFLRVSVGFNTNIDTSWTHKVFDLAAYFETAAYATVEEPALYPIYERETSNTVAQLSATDLGPLLLTNDLRRVTREFPDHGDERSWQMPDPIAWVEFVAADRAAFLLEPDASGQRLLILQDVGRVGYGRSQAEAGTPVEDRNWTLIPAQRDYDGTLPYGQIMEQQPLPDGLSALTLVGETRRVVVPSDVLDGNWRRTTRSASGDHYAIRVNDNRIDIRERDSGRLVGRIPIDGKGIELKLIDLGGALPVLILSGGQNTVDLWQAADGDGTPDPRDWQRQVLVQRSNLIAEADLNPTGRLLAFSEVVKDRQITGHIYSLDANATWRQTETRIAEGGLQFLAPHRLALTEAGHIQSVETLHDLATMRDMALGQLSDRCRYEGDSPTTSACWTAR